MAIWIDWHSHHTPPEVAERFGELTGKRPLIDNFDSPDFSKRVKELDEESATHQELHGKKLPQAPTPLETV